MMLITSADQELRPLAEFRRAAVEAAALRQRLHYDRANRVMRGANERVWQALFAKYPHRRVQKHAHRIYRILRRAQSEEGA